MFKSYLIPWGTLPAADFNAAASKHNHMGAEEIIAIVEHWCGEQAELEKQLRRKIGPANMYQFKNRVGGSLVSMLGNTVSQIEKAGFDHDLLSGFWHFLDKKWGRFPMSLEESEGFAEKCDDLTMADIFMEFSGSHNLGKDHVLKHDSGWGKTLVPGNAISPYNKCKLLYRLVELGVLLRPQMAKTYEALDDSYVGRAAIKNIKTYNEIVRHLGEHFFEFSEEQITRLQNTVLSDKEIDLTILKALIDLSVIGSLPLPPPPPPSPPLPGNKQM